MGNSLWSFKNHHSLVSGRVWGGRFPAPLKWQLWEADAGTDGECESFGLHVTGLRKPGKSKGLTQDLPCCPGRGARGSRKADTPEASSGLRHQLCVWRSWRSWASRPHFPHSQGEEIEFSVQSGGGKIWKKSALWAAEHLRCLFSEEMQKSNSCFEAKEKWGLRLQPGLDGSSICLVLPIGLPRCHPWGSVSRGPDETVRSSSYEPSAASGQRGVGTAAWGRARWPWRRQPWAGWEFSSVRPGSRFCPPPRFTCFNLSRKLKVRRGKNENVRETSGVGLSVRGWQAAVCVAQCEGQGRSDWVWFRAAAGRGRPPPFFGDQRLCQSYLLRGPNFY